MHAVSLEPRSAVLRGNLGDCYQRLGHADDARAQYAEAVRLEEADLQVSPDDPALLSQHIMHLAKAGDCAGSWDVYRRSRSRLPDRDAEILHALAKAFALCGRRSESIAALRRMTALGASPALFRAEDEFVSLRSDSTFLALTADGTR